MDKELEGSQQSRIDKLWALLDSKGTGRIDVKALQAGLRKIDHRETLSRQQNLAAHSLTLLSSSACGWSAAPSD